MRKRSPVEGEGHNNCCWEPPTRPDRRPESLTSVTGAFFLRICARADDAFTEGAAAGSVAVFAASRFMLASGAQDQESSARDQASGCLMDKVDGWVDMPNQGAGSSPAALGGGSSCSNARCPAGYEFSRCPRVLSDWRRRRRNMCASFGSCGQMAGKV